MNFTTPDNVTMFLNKTTLTSSESATIDMLIDMVDGVIKNYCGWEIMSKDYVLSVTGDGGTTLSLPQAPLNTLTSLVISGTDCTSLVKINLDDGELAFDSSAGQTFTNDGTYNNVVVTYNAGYTVIPSDLGYAASWLVAINFNRITQESIGIVNEQFNTIKIEYDKNDIPVMVKHVLDRYRHFGIF